MNEKVEGKCFQTASQLQYTDGLLDTLRTGEATDNRPEVDLSHNDNVRS